MEFYLLELDCRQELIQLKEENKLLEEVKAFFLRSIIIYWFLQFLG